MEADDSLTLGIDPGTRNMGLTFVQNRTLIAEVMDKIDIHVYHDEEYSYTHDHYHHVAQRILRKYHPYFLRCTLVGSEKVIVVISDTDVMVFIAHFLDAIRYTYPHIIITPVNSSDVRAWWGVTVKRTQAQSKKLSKGSKRLQNKKASMNATLMSPADKLRYTKYFQKYDIVKKGKTKGKKKLVKLYDPWESAMIAVYCIKNRSKVIDTRTYVTKHPTKEPSIMRMQNIQLFESQKPTEEPPKKKRKTKKQ